MKHPLIDTLLKQPLTELEKLINQGYSLSRSTVDVGNAYGIWAIEGAVYVQANQNA